MEIGARIGGDKISKLMMYSLLQHFSYFKEYINIRLGIEPLKPEFNTKYTGIAFIKYRLNFMVRFIMASIYQ